jgi:CMP-N-acetylneuraminic acid synthetase
MHIAIIPARSGSKGVTDKNMLPLWGKSLIGWAAETAHATELFSHVLLSTDSEIYAEEGQRYGCVIPYLRPAPLASDHTPIAEVLLELLSNVSGAEQWQTITLLEPTSPLRTPHIVKTCANLCIAHPDVQSSLTLTEVPLHYHSQKQFELDNHGQARYCHPHGGSVTNRQNLKTTYIRNGAGYTFKTDSFRKTTQILHGNTRGLVLQDLLINIDTQEDIQLLRHYESQNPTPDWAKIPTPHA